MLGIDVNISLQYIFLLYNRIKLDSFDSFIPATQNAARRKHCNWLLNIKPCLGKSSGAFAENKLDRSQAKMINWKVINSDL